MAAMTMFFVPGLFCRCVPLSLAIWVRRVLSVTTSAPPRAAK